MSISTSRSDSPVYTGLTRQTPTDVLSRTGDVTDSVIRVQDLMQTPPNKVARRWLWFWLRIIVRDGKERVNIRIPIPLPFIGALLPRGLSPRQALDLYEELRRNNGDLGAARDLLDTSMAFEFIRVEDGDELVIIGVD